jgi:hypothetical protein
MVGETRFPGVIPSRYSRTSPLLSPRSSGPLGARHQNGSDWADCRVAHPHRSRRPGSRCRGRQTHGSSREPGGRISSCRDSTPRWANARSTCWPIEMRNRDSRRRSRFEHFGSAADRYARLCGRTAGKARHGSTREGSRRAGSRPRSCAAQCPIVPRCGWPRRGVHSSAAVDTHNASDRSLPDQPPFGFLGVREVARHGVQIGAQPRYHSAYPGCALR